MVMPLWDENPFRRPALPVVTWCLIALNVAIFIVEVVVPPDLFSSIVLGLGMTPAALFRVSSVAGGMQQDALGWLPREVSLATYMFLHADLGHLLGNMVFLWVFGDNIEDAMGRRRFFVFYAICGIASALIFAFSAPTSTSPLVGASGAIAGVVAAYAMTRPCAKITVFVFGLFLRIRSIWVIGAWAAIQVAYLAAQPAGDNIAYWAHAGGLIVGALLFPLMKMPGTRLFECIGAEPPRPQNAR